MGLLRGEVVRGYGSVRLFLLFYHREQAILVQCMLYLFKRDNI